MALGWFNRLAGDRADAGPAASNPGTEINPAAVAAAATSPLRVHSTTGLDDGLANELPALGYISRQTLADQLEARSDGRLQLDPDPE